MNMLLTIKRWLDNAWYWLRAHTVHRYHLLDLRDRGEGHGYTWGWIDRDWLMYLACFKCLTEYVEKEDPTVGLGGMEEYPEPEGGWSEEDRQAIEAQVRIGREIRELYEWWTKERKKERVDLDAMLKDVHSTMLTEPTDNGYHRVTGFAYNVPDGQSRLEAWSTREAELDAKDDAQLLRLINIRRYLWT